MDIQQPDESPEAQLFPHYDPVFPQYDPVWVYPYTPEV